jgi:hypothetical protein
MPWSTPGGGTTPILITNSEATTRDVASVAVHTRDLWSDPWIARPELQCTQVSLAASPSTSHATFRHRYGKKITWDATGVSTQARFTVNPRSYVRVTITPTPGLAGANPIYWYGIWKQATDEGLVQTIPAVGLDGLLAFSQIDDAKYVDMFGAIRDAGRGLTFNAGGKPNRSENKRPVYNSNCYLFAENEERAQFWSTRDIVEYLCEAHPPTDKDDAIILTFSLFNEDALPDYDRPEVPAHDRDVLTVLRSVISRHRLLSFSVSAVDVPGSVFVPAVSVAYVRVFTFTETALDLTDASGVPFSNVVGTIPANETVLNLDIQRDTTAQASLSIDAQHVADRVTVLGAARVSVFSVSYDDGSLVAGWDFPDELAHKTAARDAIDWPDAAEVREQERRNKEARASDRLQHVFSHFLLHKWWEQHTKDGQGQGADTPIAIDDDDDPFRIMRASLLPLKELPLLRGYDYADDIVSDAATARVVGHRGTKVGEPPFEPLPLLAVIRVPNYRTRDDGSPAKFVFIDQIGKAADLELEEYDDGTPDWKGPVARQWSGRVRVLRDVAGIEVDVTGAEQHMLGRDEYDGHEDAIKGAWDWRDMIVTLAVQELRRASVVWPETPASVGEFLNEITIDAGDTYELVYMTPGTIVGVDETAGELIRSNGGYMHDDRDFLRIIAQRAYEWYRVPRYSLNLTTSWIDSRVEIGAYIHEIKRLDEVHPVGSVITQITYDFPVVASETPPPPRVSIRTAFGELDAARVI